MRSKLILALVIVLTVVAALHAQATRVTSDTNARLRALDISFASARWLPSNSGSDHGARASRGPITLAHGERSLDEVGLERRVFGPVSPVPGRLFKADGIDGERSVGADSQAQETFEAAVSER